MKAAQKSRRKGEKRRRVDENKHWEDLCCRSRSGQQTKRSEMINENDLFLEVCFCCLAYRDQFISEGETFMMLNILAL